MAPSIQSTRIRAGRMCGTFVAMSLSVVLSACASDNPFEPIHATTISQAKGNSLVAGLAKGPCIPVRGGVPDLVVIAVTPGSATTSGVIPVTATVKNVGTACAGVFRIEAQIYHNADFEPARFSVTPSSVVDATGMTLNSLEAGATLTLAGSIALPEVPHGETVLLQIVADGCLLSSDPTSSSYCRVAESDEGNNKRQAFSKIP